MVIILKCAVIKINVPKKFRIHVNIFSPELKKKYIHNILLYDKIDILCLFHIRIKCNLLLNRFISNDFGSEYQLVVCIHQSYQIKRNK